MKSSEGHNIGDGNSFFIKNVVMTAWLVVVNSIAVNRSIKRAQDYRVVVTGAEQLRKELSWNLKRLEPESVISRDWQ